MTTSQGGIAAVLAYTVAVVTPLGLATTEVMPGQGFVINLSVALGFVALSILGLQALVGARLPWMTRRFGSDGVGRFHRHITLLAVLAAFGHPALLYLQPVYRQLFDVPHAPLRAQLAWLSLAALVVLIGTSMLRRLLRLPYPVWHVLHSALAILVVLAALGHALLVNYYMSTPLVRGAWLSYGVLYLWLTAYVRLLRPIRLWRHPWTVIGLHPEPGNALTITLQPPPRTEGRHAASRRFRAGQFAWILTGHNPFALTYYPFSLSSSADGRGLDFTIKHVGDFTGAARKLRLGDVLYLDGPHGAFTIDRTPGPGFVFIAAGVGVTPFLSMLATLADRQEKRPCLLFLGNRSELGITGVRQLHGLSNRLDLTVVHCITQPSAGWSGQRGRITAEVLRFYLPENYQRLEFFICASPEAATSYRSALRELRVSGTQIHSEQFVGV